MLKNITGEVSISWGDKEITKPMSEGLFQLAGIALAPIIISSCVGFILLGWSVVSTIVHIVLTVIGLCTAVYFGRVFLIGMIFKDSTEGIDKMHTADTGAETKAEA